MKFKNKPNPSSAAVAREVESELYLPYYRKTVTYSQICIDIDEPFRDPSYYRTVIQALEELSEDDQVKIRFNSPGGNAWGLVTLLNAIRTTEADVLGIIEGECHSAASILALHCKQVIVMPYSTMMIHACSYGTVGKDSDIVSHVNHATEWNRKLIESTYEGFLSPAEIKEVLSGREFWFDSEEVTKRFEARGRHLEKQSKLEAKVSAGAKTKSKKQVAPKDSALDYPPIAD